MNVVIFPLPLQGPINTMLKLAEILCLQNISVTFILTQHIQRRLFQSSNIQSYMTKYRHTFRFKTIPDGLPEDHPRTIFGFSELLTTMEAVAAPILRHMLIDGATCIIAEGILTFAADIAAQIGLPIFCFDTISASALWTCMCLPKLIQARELPFQDENLDEAVRNVPGMEGILRRRDLPGLCRAIDFDDHETKLLLKQMHNLPRFHGFILNTFQQLDSPILSQMLEICPNIYAVGPLHTHLQRRLSNRLNSSSILEEDRTCISWLDKQPSKSVVYVSFGSLAVMKKDQFLEFWNGLVNSGSRFLWARRPGSLAGFDATSDDGIPVELLQVTRERGCIVSWAPQPEVLAHPAVGGFLTHSGWNSTLESIVAGKPMICWPHHFDQQVNSRYVGEVWKLGLDMKDSCDRVVIEKMVREVMELRKDEFLERAQQMSEAAESSVREGGSSSADLDRLIHDINNMKLNCPSN